MTSFINIHAHYSLDESIIEIINLKPGQLVEKGKLYSYGVHPWNVTKLNIDEELAAMNELLGENKLIAVGEMGLDRAIKTELSFQTGVFIRQHQLAQWYQKPVIIHCVRAWADLLSIRKQLKTDLPWIFHGFNGTLQTARQLIKSGCFLSFGHALLVSAKVQDVFNQLPLEHLFFETDDRMEKTELIYEKAAGLKHLSIEKLKDITYKNFIQVFYK